MMTFPVRVFIPALSGVPQVARLIVSIECLTAADLPAEVISRVELQLDPQQLVTATTIDVDVPATIALAAGRRHEFSARVVLHQGDHLAAGDLINTAACPLSKVRTDVRLSPV